MPTIMLACGRRVRKDLTGLKTKHLEVIGVDHEIGKGVYWFCRCDCGKVVRRRGRALNPESTASCGCHTVDRIRETHTTHGMRQSSEYGIWQAIKNRCNNNTTLNYHRYGGRGIKVCDRWMNSFEMFLEDMGPRPSTKHSVERKDGSAGYSPDNCVWATMSQQARNTRRNRVITHNGVTRLLCEWSEVTHLSADVIARRIELGWSIERALTQPLDLSRKRKIVE